MERGVQGRRRWRCGEMGEGRRKGWEREGMEGMEGMEGSGEGEVGEEEAEVTRDAAEKFAKERTILDATMEEDIRMIKEEDDRGMGVPRRSGVFRIGVEYTHEIVVEVAEEDPFDEADADKENWNRQILRDDGGDRGALQVP